ncbi:MAG: hypothetical protein IJT36_01635 [Alphaproteobacteria bacterium]|nr:hypothetical protein [Alphaproteobacteria bacterium]
MLIVICKPEFKIRTKEDAKIFLTKYVQGDGEVCIKVGDCVLYKICRYGCSGEISIFIKTGNISDIFNPDVRIGYYNPQKSTDTDLNTAVDAVYLIRKHINNRWYM